MPFFPALALTDPFAPLESDGQGRIRLHHPLYFPSTGRSQVFFHRIFDATPFEHLKSQLLIIFFTINVSILCVDNLDYHQYTVWGVNIISL